MEEQKPSVWKQYGPMILMGSCCLAPALIAGAISLAAATGVGLSTPLTVAALGGAGVYLWTRQRRQGSGPGQGHAMPCCPAPESAATAPPDDRKAVGRVEEKP